MPTTDGLPSARVVLLASLCSTLFPSQGNRWARACLGFVGCLVGAVLAGTEGMPDRTGGPTNASTPHTDPVSARSTTAQGLNLQDDRWHVPPSGFAFQLRFASLQLWLGCWKCILGLDSSRVLV